MIKDFALPDLGEGLTESEIVQWHVAVGDPVTLNQPLAEVETAKAIVQLPSPFAGVIAKLYAEPGATVTVGSPIVAFELEGVASAAGSQSPNVEGTPPERNTVLVGYGPAVETGDKPKRKARSNSTAAQVSGSGAESPVSARVRATPPVRKLAADLGVDLTMVSGTGDDGMITRDDVRAATVAVTTAVGASSVRPALDVADTRTPIRGVRRATAAAMVSSAFTAPHVTEFLTVDVTRTLELVARLKAVGDQASVLAVVAKAVCLAARRTPSINSRWDDAAAEIVEFGHVGLGIAVATERGLLVPGIPRADLLTVPQLTTAIAELASTARAGTTTPAAFSASTITISNVGVFGIDAGTPILNPGEAAILATGAIRRIPWEHEGAVALRDVMTLSLSFDHRLVDGEQGARFLVDVGRIVSDPGTVLALV